MKTYPNVFKVPSHKDVSGNGGIALRILNLSTRRRWVVIFTRRLLYPLDSRLGWKVDTPEAVEKPGGIASTLKRKRAGS